MKKNGKIFIQIASYRDPELLKTLKDCVENSDNPENLVFGICWQHSKEDEWDNLDEYVKLLMLIIKIPKVRVGQEIHYNNSMMENNTHFN